MGSASSDVLEVTDMEVLEVTETDAELLRELLEDESESKEMEKDSVKQAVHELENELNGNSDEDKHGGLERSDEGVKGDDGLGYCWAEMAEMAPDSPSVDETMGWYVDEFDCNYIDYSHLYSRVFFEEETDYCCLWQD